MHAHGFLYCFDKKLCIYYILSCFTRYCHNISRYHDFTSYYLCFNCTHVTFKKIYQASIILLNVEESLSIIFLADKPVSRHYKINQIMFIHIK